MITGNRMRNSISIDGVKLQLSPSLMIANHSPDGFNWGYGGSGPAQLALALLLHFTDRVFAENNYQQFKWDVVAKLDQDRDFSLPDWKVVQWITSHGGEAL